MIIPASPNPNPPKVQGIASKASGMAIFDLIVTVAHMVFTGVWTGSVVFVSLGVLPSASAGMLSADALGTIVERLRWVSRISALVLLVTGGPLTSSQYTFGQLLGTMRGYAVLAMILLWVVLVVLVEIAGGRAQTLDEITMAGVPDDTQILFHAGAVAAVLLLVVSGYLVVG